MKIIQIFGRLYSDEVLIGIMIIIYLFFIKYYLIELIRINSFLDLK